MLASSWTNLFCYKIKIRCVFIDTPFALEGVKRLDKQLSAREYFIQRYGKEYTSIIDHLEELITSGTTGNDKFVAVGIEAGLGKSRETDRIISEYLNRQAGFCARSFLLVKRFVKDVQLTTEFLNSNSTIGNPVALGITHENWTDFQANLAQIQDYPVVIITHARYFRLSQENYIRPYFELNRHTLIIDEQMELPIYSFSKQSWMEVNNSLPTMELRELHNKICQPLLTQLKCIKPSADSSLQKVVLSIDASLIDEYDKLIDINWRHFGNEAKRNKAKAFVEFLKCAQQYTCLYNNERVSTYNKSAYLWKLSNNIILDANAGTDKRYTYAKNIVIDKPSLAKVIDHSDTNIHPILFNSSRSRIQRVIQPYYDKVCGLIAEKHNRGDKTLIIGHNQHEHHLLKALETSGLFHVGIGDKYNGEDIAVAHFGAIIGQNYWRGFNKVWVIASPNYPMEVYPLYWIFFSRTPIRNHSLKMSGTKGKKGKYQFNNKTFEAIRHGCLVSDVYQAVKRINRDGRLPADIYVVHGDIDVINDFSLLLKNVKVRGAMELEVEVTDDAKTKTTKVSKNEQLVNLLKSLAPGIYPKKQIYNMLGWKNNGDLSRYLRDEEIQAKRIAGEIDWNDKAIIIHSRTVVAK